MLARRSASLSSLGQALRSIVKRRCIANRGCPARDRCRHGERLGPCRYRLECACYRRLRSGRKARPFPRYGPAEAVPWWWTVEEIEFPSFRSSVCIFVWHPLAWDCGSCPAWTPAGSPGNRPCPAQAVPHSGLRRRTQLLSKHILYHIYYQLSRSI